MDAVTRALLVIALASCTDVRRDVCGDRPSWPDVVWRFEGAGADRRAWLPMEGYLRYQAFSLALELFYACHNFDAGAR